MTSNIDIDAYLDRSGYEGSRHPSLETLAALHLAHPGAIPFENLDPLLRRPVRLDAASLEQKLVRDRRGGYCYEHNQLFGDVLKGMGYQVSGLAARVMWNAPDEEVRPRSHMLLRVVIDDTAYIADVGFGGLTLTAPLRLDVNTDQTTPHEPFRILRTGREFVLQARVRGTWRALYRFTDEAQFPVDYEVANWYTSTHPRSHFLTSLIAARVLPDRRLALLNTEWTTYLADGTTERRAIASVPDAKAVLQDVFGITLPRDPGLERALRQIVEPAP